MHVPQTSAWKRLDEESRTRLLEGAVRDVARRSPVGSLVYFLTTAALLFGSTCLRDHPFLTVSALTFTFMAGVTRSLSSLRLLKLPAPTRLWTLLLQASTLLTVIPWGLFCAAILYFYTDAWPSTFLLVVGAALAGGAVNSLAPQFRLGAAAVIAIVLPTGICALLLGTVRSQILGVSTCAYLSYLLLQLRHASSAYWKVATAPALEAMLSRQAATQSAIRFQTLFEDAPIGIYLAAPDGQIEVVNGALAHLLGLTNPEQIAGHNLHEFSPPTDRAEMNRLVEQRGSVTGRESDWLRRDGARIRVRESIRTVQSGTDGRGRLLGIVEDVTAIYAADQARQQLIEILEGTSDFVERIGVSGETLYMNRACRALAGDSAASPVWVRSGSQEVIRARLSVAGQEGIWQGESWLMAADGRTVPVSQVVISHRAADGSVHAYSIVSRDISAMRAAQKALKDTEEQLFQAQRLESLGRLAGGIAHDFNNLLTIILGHASVLEYGPIDDESRAGLAEIGKAAQRAADLTKQLLAFSRKQVLSKGIVDVKEVVQGAELMLRRPIGGAIELVTELGEGTQTVLADAAQLEQVLINLILNARDAMPHGGTATIGTSITWEIPEGAPGKQPVEFVRISVSDTGIGMDEDTLARIFEPFFTTKGRGRGTGLGLATAYGFIKQSGGSISVSSKPGAGSVFTILLPACSGAVTARAQEMPAELGGDECILVVDDEPALRGLLRNTLAGYGYRVVEARDGEEALRLAREAAEPFRLLVTDVIMPCVTGPELARRMEVLFPGIAVLFISGYPGETEAERAEFGPGTAWLAKPFTAEALLRHVRRELTRNVKSAGA
jgi:PAS domain S-box-containing protein